MVDIKDIPINQMILKKAIGDDELESYNINLRNEGGGRALELKITCADGTRRVVVRTAAFALIRARLSCTRFTERMNAMRKFIACISTSI